MKVKLLKRGIEGYEPMMPMRATKGSAGFDLRVPCDTVCKSGRQIIPLGFEMELDWGYEAEVKPRSGFSVNGFEGSPTGGSGELKRYNADVEIGTIDCDYRDECGVIVINHGEPFIIPKHTRIAQMVIRSVYMGELTQTEELDKTIDRGGGIGHTGTR